MATKTSSREKSRWGQEIVVQAVWESFVKLNPRTLAANPVMFVVEVGAALTSIDLVRGMVQHTHGFGFSLQITLWLWFTVLFANFAEAMAEGRGKAQAEALRKSRAETVARQTEAGRQHRIRAGLAIARGRHSDGDRGRIRSRRRRSDRRRCVGG